MFRGVLLRLLHLYARSLGRGQMASLTLRRLWGKHCNVEIGLHSYGCFDLIRYPAGTKIGRFVSIGPGSRVLNANHPLDYPMLHPYLYNPALGLCVKENIHRSKLEICDDAWVGANVIILSGVKRIGVGAVVGAGSVLTKNVGDFEIWAGNPARLLKKRLDEEKIDVLKKAGPFSRELDDIKWLASKSDTAESSWRAMKEWASQ